jgi:hypothetical protein
MSNNSIQSVLLGRQVTVDAQSYSRIPIHIIEEVAGQQGEIVNVYLVHDHNSHEVLYDVLFPGGRLVEYLLGCQLRFVQGEKATNSERGLTT